MNTIKKIGVLTSGGDSPGMNAAIRSVTRAALYKGLEVTGIRYGYQGAIEADFVEMKKLTVSNMIQRGGTILKSARSAEFRTPEGRKKAAENLRSQGIEALVAIGGDGTFQGGTILQQEHGFPVIGIPGTIDNDLSGTDETIGYDTALNTALDAIDKIRDTADAHERMFLVEVMGRDAGFLALETGIACGAELTLLPETLVHIKEVKETLRNILTNKKRSTLVVVAEGDESGGAMELYSNLKEDFSDIDTRVCVLGHIQRGGNPTARDRVLASRLGVAAVNALLDGHVSVMVGVVNNNIKLTPLKSGWSKKKSIQTELLDLTKILK
ncbi:6-phosphofructokinase [Cyclonatronum proteinivorum]|uniref:ATP-dependent 6-phosphofructokinase n=1 Tax=Cyclonatronum proteinivorum TaxID=1457365 RepID=A0A345UM29_9BACT|nr:6-phosphofructokinase [Cyclonatronum proteinivorum]AXJ01531.1 6-phosphofructokinase [Cyclonatronum proteinivorum]